MYFEQYLCQTCHTLFSGGQDRQELFVRVEVSSPDGNFDTLRKNFFGAHAMTQPAFWLHHCIDAEFRHTPKKFERGLP